MIEFLKQLFTRCKHEWKVEKSGVKVHELDPFDMDEIIGCTDFVKWRCSKCQRVRFRKA